MKTNHAIFAVLFVVVFASLSVNVALADKLNNPLLESLVNGAGVQIEPEKTFPLPMPTAGDNMSSKEEAAAIREAAGGYTLDRFTKDSVVAPQVLKIDSIGKLSQGGNVQAVDLWFIAYGTLQQIEDEKLFEGLAEEEKKEAENREGPKEEGRALTKEELAERKLEIGKQPDGSETSYGVMRANILDKVLLSGISFSSSTRNKNSITVAMKIDERFIDDKKFPCQWQPLDNGKLGKAYSYSALAAYARATELKTIKGALLIEVHAVFAEPTGWFDGKNLLRSKLPPAAQDSVRKFRRKL